jgi:hypothetical protein
MKLRYITKNSIWIGLLLCFAFPSFASAQQPGSSAVPSPNDPLFDCNMAEVDQQMYMVLDMIKTEYADDSLFLEKMREAQSAWETYREKFLLSVYPEENVRLKYGRVFDACWCFHYTAKTKKRINELKMWLDKVEEGDVCSGSVRFK